MIKQKKYVHPSVYTKKYYLSDCTGFEEFKKSYGEDLEPRFKELIKHLKITKNMKVLDVGCGRGEMVLYVAKQGADSIGIDYSIDAIKLARLARDKKNKKLRNRMEFYIMNAKQMKFKDFTFDTIIITDVIEHLYDDELNAVFSEIYRVLKKNGILVIHTAPNKLFNEITYKYYSYPVSTFLVNFWNFITGKKYPNIAKPELLKTSSHKIMHVNEPTYFSLRDIFRKHKFKGSIVSSNITVKKKVLGLKDIIFNFVVFLHPFSKFFPLNILYGSDFISVLKISK